MAEIERNDYIASVIDRKNARITELEARIAELEKENKILRDAMRKLVAKLSQMSGLIR